MFFFSYANNESQYKYFTEKYFQNSQYFEGAETLNLIINTATHKINKIMPKFWETAAGLVGMVLVDAN